MLHNSLHGNKNLCGQNRIVFGSQGNSSDRPSQAVLSGPLAFGYFFLCQKALSTVLAFSLSVKFLHSFEEPSSYIVSSIKAFLSPVERDRHPLSVLPWSLCSLAVEAKIYFLLFPVPDNGRGSLQWIFDGVSFGNLVFPESAIWFGEDLSTLSSGNGQSVFLKKSVYPISRHHV